MEVGIRVVRGPDWDSNANEDGGEGFVGTVVEVGGKSSSQLPENLVWVQWDSGLRHDHRAGYYGAYDLCVLDSAPTGICHPGIYCEGCQEDPILGMRWHCTDCKGTSNLCTSCYMADKHNKNHKFERMERPDHQGFKVGVRLGEKRIQAKGIFRGAKVKRGRDWKYDDRQDGGEGKEGVVKDITVWQHTPRSAVVVSWDEAGENKYRLCFKGKVDLTCVSPSVGFCYYKSHLPRFGEKPRKKGRNDGTTNNADGKNAGSEKNAFVVGDDVLIDLSPGLLKSLTEKVCSWDEQMREYIGKVGEVHSFTRTGNVTISFDDGAVWTFPRNALAKRGGQSKTFNKSGNNRNEAKDEGSPRTTTSGSGQRRVSPKIASREDQRGRGQDTATNGKRESRSQGPSDAPFKLGDVVKLLKDGEKVKRLQVGHGPWNQAVSESLGMVGRVMNVDSDGDVEVRIDGKTNVIVLNPATLCRAESTTGPKAFNKDARQEKSVASARMLHDSQKPEPKASTGDRKSPQQKQQQQGNQEQKQQQQQQQKQQQQQQKQQQQQQQQQEQQKQQQQQQEQQKQQQQQQQKQQEAANIDPRERNELAQYLVGNAAAGNEPAVRAVLREKPEIIDCLSGGHTALHQACHGGHFDVATTLIGAGAGLTPRDLSGYTALHHAAYGDYSGATAELLITVGADKDDATNPAINTPLHLAVEKHNSVSAVMLIKAGCDVNKKSINGNTALHEAVRLGNTLIVEALLRAPSLDLKAVNKKGMNPFLMAVERKYKGAVAAMVKQSPDIVRVPQFQSGMTALHYAAANDDAETAALLLNTGKCDLDALNKKGVSAHEFAASMNKSSVADLLSRYRDGLASGVSFERAVPPGKVYREICIGDTVRVVDDPKTVEMLQAGHGGYNFQMSLVTGKLGTITEIQAEGDVLVYFADLDIHFIMNPTVLELVMPLECDQHAQDCGATQGATPFVYTGEDTSPPPAVSSLHPMFELMLKMKSVLRPQHEEERDTVGMLFHAVVTNWKSRVRDILGALPGLVNSRVEERTPLHVACFDGSVEVARMLLDAGAHLEAQDDCGFSPLHFSVFGDRSGETVELLVSHGAKIDANYNMHLANPVSTAVLRCNEAAVKILIQHGCDLNLQDGYGDTALHSAVRTEKDSITGMLLSSASINPNIYNNSGLNPLHMAVVHGNEAIVRKFVQGAPGLLEIPTADDFGRTALHLACVYNHPGVAEILLDTDLCDIHALDATSRVPLSWASYNHMHSVVQRLLEMYDSENTTLAEACGAAAASGECGAGPSESDAGAEATNTGTFGQKLELGDIVKVHPSLEVVISLQDGLRDWADQISKTLDRLGEVVTVDSDGNVGVLVQGMTTPFLYNSASLQLLSKSMISQTRQASAVTDETNDVSQGERENKQAKQRQKAGGKEATAEQSLEKETAQSAKDDEEEEMVDVMVDHTQLGGMLLKSTAMGYVAKVKRFVDLNPDMIDYKPFGFSALHVACQDGFGEIIKILIQKGAKKEIQDSAGLSPLQAAAVHDKSGVAAGTLLDFMVDPNAATADGRTPLHLAVLRDNEATAKVLVQRGCDVNLLDGEGNTALHHAVAHEKDRLVDVILERASHDPLRPNKRGLNPLHVAAEAGNEYAARKLIEYYPQMVNEPSGDGSTPLHLASSYKRHEIVKLLLEKETIELNLSNRNNKTALQLAKAVGDEDIIDLLAQSGATFAEFAEVSTGAAGQDTTTAENDKRWEALGKTEKAISQSQDKYHGQCNIDNTEEPNSSVETRSPSVGESPRWSEQASSENERVSKTNLTEDNEASAPESMVISNANDGLMHTNTESKDPLTVCEGDGANAYSSLSNNLKHGTGGAKYTPKVRSDKWTSLETGRIAYLESLKEDTRLNCDVILDQNSPDVYGKTDMESTKAQNSQLSPLPQGKRKDGENEEDGRGDIAADVQRIDNVQYSGQPPNAEEQLNDDWYSSEEDNDQDGNDEITSSCCKDDGDFISRYEQVTVSSSSEGDYGLPAGSIEEHDLVNEYGESSNSGDSLNGSSRWRAVQKECGDNPGVYDEQLSPLGAAMEGSEFSEAECLLCKQNPATVRYHPCRHTITCPSCASQISNCLLCDSPIIKKTIEEQVRNQGEQSPASLGEDKCCICWENQKNVTFQCGHLCTCQECSVKVDYCPFCATKVQDRITTFY